MSALELAPHLEAHEPPEERGLGRDDVALLVATRHDGHARPRALRRPAPLPLAGRPARRQHLGDAAGGARRSARRAPCSSSACRRPSAAGQLGRRAANRDGRAAPPAADRRRARPARGRPGRAARARTRAATGSARPALDRREPLDDYLGLHGQPIRYGYVPERWPIDAYQTVFALEPGSAEMPSAGRPFTTGARDRARRPRRPRRAADAAHRRLLAGAAASRPYPERYRVPETTARLVNAVHAWGGRVIAVGHHGRARARDAWPTRTAPSSRGGSDEPRSSHPSAACAPSTGCSPAGTSPRRRTC